MNRLGLLWECWKAGIEHIWATRRILFGFFILATIAFLLLCIASEGADAALFSKIAVGFVLYIVLPTGIGFIAKFFNLHSGSGV